MPCGTEEFFNFSRWFGEFDRCANKNVDRTQLIKSYCLRALERTCLPLSRAFRGLTQSLPRTEMSGRSPLHGRSPSTFLSKYRKFK